MWNKTENMALCIGLIICGVITSPAALDRALTIRHMVWCLTTMAMCLYLIRKTKDLSVRNTTIFLIFGIYCVATTISIMKASNTSESFYFILTAWLSLIFFFCAASMVDREFIIKSMTYFGLLLACFGLYQVILYGSNLIGTHELGFTCGRNLWSSTLMLMLPFALYQAFNKNVIGIITVIILLIDIICLQTRSVYAGLIIATVVTLAIYNKKLVPLFLAGVMICIFAFPKISDTGSLGLRLQKWERTAKAFIKNPVFGVGAGNWKTATAKYGIEYTENEVPMIFQRAHNDFLEVLSEIGLIGGLCYLGVFVVAIAYTFQLSDKILAWTMRFGVVSYMAMASFTFPKERALHTMLILTIIAIITRAHKKRMELVSVRYVKVFAVCLLISLTLLFVNYQRHHTESYMKKAMCFREQRDWNSVLKLIDENYTPFSTMLNYGVTPIYYYKGEANFSLGNHEQAYIDFQEANKLHPNHPATLWNIGSYKSRNNEREIAKIYFNKAVDIMPSLASKLER